jgi:murein L,D-transpeptidase YafK
MKVLCCMSLLLGLLFSSGDVLASLSKAEMKADLVVVKKSQYSLILMKDGKPIKRYWIALGSNPKGPKIRRGDKRTPEGRYLLDYKKDESGFYKAIHISYPNLADLRRAKDLGVEPGNMVMIHGQPNYATEEQTAVQNSNWTNGCIALLNQDMAELWELVEPGTPIEIRP